MNIKCSFAIWNEPCEFCSMMSYRRPSGFLLCCESLYFLKLMLCSWLCSIWYGHELIIESLSLEVFREWQLLFDDECCQNGEIVRPQKWLRWIWSLTWLSWWYKVLNFFIIWVETVSKILGALEVKRQGTTKMFNDWVTYMAHMWFYVFMCYSWC